jgi:hypothetical protein
VALQRQPLGKQRLWKHIKVGWRRAGAAGMQW